MSFTQVLQELTSLTVEQRQLLINRALELDDHSLPADVEELVQERLAEHRRDPSSSVPIDDMIARVTQRNAQ